MNRKHLKNERLFGFLYYDIKNNAQSGTAGVAIKDGGSLQAANATFR